MSLKDLANILQLTTQHCIL